MQQVITTDDGSSTLFNPTLNEHYHSTHGAINESMHVFINTGLHEKLKESRSHLNILEIGMGTGLNVLLTFLHAQEISIHYSAIEAFPIDLSTALALNYCSQLNSKALESTFKAIHSPGNTVSLSETFHLSKIHAKLETLSLQNNFYDVIFFDAFSPEAQPELWDESILRMMADCMAPKAILTTYCAKGYVRRNLQQAGLVVERLPGPTGKREILRARKA